MPRSQHSKSIGIDFADGTHIEIDDEPEWVKNGHKWIEDHKEELFKPIAEKLAKARLEAHGVTTHKPGELIFLKNREHKKAIDIALKNGPAPTWLMEKIYDGDEDTIQKIISGELIVLPGGIVAKSEVILGPKH